MKQYTPTLLKPGLLAVLTSGAVLCGSAQNLIHRYSFNDPAGGSTFTDSVAGANGTLISSASLDGSRLQLDGMGGYAVLPSNLISTNTQVTLEFWASYNNNQTWTRTFAFGDQTGAAENTGLDYTHFAPGNWQNLNFQTNSSGGVFANNPGGLNGQTNVHVTVVVDPVGNRMFYYNGTKVTSDPVLNNGT